MTSRNNTPFYKLRLGGDSYLWTVLMFGNNFNKTGDTIRVVGYLDEISGLSESERQFLDAEYMVISFGLVDLKKLNLLFADGAQTQKQEWIEGENTNVKIEKVKER